MLALDIILPNGMIAVYGVGTTGTLPSGIVLPDNFRYGTVYHIWSGGETYVYGGDVVFWKEGSQECRLATATLDQFTIVPARLVTKDNIVKLP